MVSGELFVVTLCTEITDGFYGYRDEDSCGACTNDITSKRISTIWATYSQPKVEGKYTL
jgi:hypothetical protein